MRSVKYYLEKDGLDTTYWGKKIIAAEEYGAFAVGDIMQAEGWVTCACGKITQDIPRTAHIPNDDTLAEMGVDFSQCVKKNWFMNAAVLLVKIENRAKIVSMLERNSFLLMKDCVDIPSEFH
jgi:hypothetical protein